MDEKQNNHTKPIEITRARRRVTANTPALRMKKPRAVSTPATVFFNES